MKERKQQKKCRMTAFAISTAMLAGFGILMQILCEAMGYTPFLKDYLLHLIPCGVIFLLLYFAAVGRRTGNRLRKWISWILLILTLLWVAFVGLGLLRFRDEVDDYDRHLRQMATGHLLMLAKPVGRGEPCYEYPDSVLEGYEEGREDLPMEVRQAFRERGEAEFYFKDYRGSRMLPVLSYTYGLWVNWLAVALGAVWSLLGAAEWLRLRGRQERVLYLIPYGVILLQIIYALLGAFGESESWLFYPFSGNTFANLSLVVPMLGMLFGLIHAPVPKTIKMPVEDYLREIVEE